MKRSAMSFCRHAAPAAVTALAIGLLLGSSTATAEKAGELDGEKIQMLFVQSATGGSFDGKRVALEGVGSTLMFTDRPARLDGHMSTANFLKGWDKGPDSFSDDPPNAVLSILGGSKETENVVVELLDPKLDGNTVSYQAKAKDGTLPKSFGTASLFIDGKAGGYIGAALGGAVLGRGLTRANMNAEYAREEASRPPAYAPPQAAPDYSYRTAAPPPCTCNCQ